MKNHLKKSHAEPPKYKCKECQFSSNYIADAWKHGFEEHPENPSEFKPQLTENMILKVDAEQNTLLIEEMATIKSDIKESFDKLFERLESNVGGLKDESNTKSKALTDAVTKLSERVSKCKKPAKTIVRNLNFVQTSGLKPKASRKVSSSESKSAKTVPSTSSMLPPSTKSLNTKAKAAPKVSPPASFANAPKSSSESKPKQKTSFLSKPKELYIADAVGHTASLLVE